MGSAPSKWTCTASRDFSDHDSWLTGPYWPLGRRRKKNKLMCYPQQFGRSWRFLAVCPGTFWNLISHLRQNLWTSSAFGPGTLRNLGWSAPEPSRTRRNFISYLHRNLLEPHQPSAPKPLDLICFLPRNPPEPWLICTGALPNPPKLHQLSAPEPSGTSSAIWTGTLRFITYLPRNPPEPHQPSAPEPSGISSAICTEPSGTFSGTWCCSCTGSHQNKLMCYPQQFGRSWRFLAVCPGTFWNLISHLRQNLWTSSRNPPEPWLICTGALPNPPELHQLSAPEPSGTSSAICTKTSGPHLLSASEPSGTLADLHRSPPEPAETSSAICTGTLWNLISHLDRNPPLHHLSAPEPSGTSSAICAGTLRNFISHLHRTLRNLLRNLVLQLHRIAPELFWAKDPIASFAVGELFWVKDPIASFAVGEKPSAGIRLSSVEN